jgi:hypothetical protein
MAELSFRLIDWTSQKANSYLLFLKKALVWFTAIAISMFIFLVIAIVFRIPWLISLVGIILAFSVTALLLLCLPLGTLATLVVTRVRAVKAYLQIVGGVLLFLLLLTFYFSVLPISNNPGAIALIILLFSIMAVLWAIFGIEIDPKRILISIGVVFTLTVVSIVLPKTFSEIFTMKGRLDEVLAECVKDVSSCKDQFTTKSAKISTFSGYYYINLKSVTRVGDDIKIDFTVSVPESGGFLSVQDDIDMDVYDDKSYMRDNLGNRYSIKYSSLRGENIKFPKGTEEVIWIVFGDVRPDAINATIVINLGYGRDKNAVFKNIKLKAK